VTVLVSISDLIISRGEMCECFLLLNGTVFWSRVQDFSNRSFRIIVSLLQRADDQHWTVDLFSLLLCEQFEDNSQFVDNPQLLLPSRPSMRRRIIGSSSPEKPVAGLFFTLKIVIFNSCVPMTSDKPEKINSVPSSSKGIV
jgi:hypothetical protein